MNVIGKQKLSADFREQALSLGFSFCGFSRARRLDEEAERLESWLKSGHHGRMDWMERHFDLRLDPTLLVPGAKTVISLLYNYHNPQKPQDATVPRIASYAYGRDYHKVLKKKLGQLMKFLETRLGAEVAGRAFVDSAPVMERQWAAQSGLGWMGKNTLLINKGHGSWFFLAELILEVEFEYDAPVKDHCGTCTACIDACPTEAITPYHLAAEKCISYLTIELKEQVPEPFRDKLENWVFGCDICQEVCPWNRFARPHHETDFEPRFPVLHWSRKQWMDASEALFEEHFAATPLKRAGLNKIKSSIASLLPADP